MNLLIVNMNFYPSTLGGPSLSLYWLAKSFVKQGVDVWCVTTNGSILRSDILFDRWIKIDGINVFYSSVKDNDLFHNTVTREVMRQIKKIDVIFLGSICYRPAFFTSLFAKLYSKKVIWSPRGELFAPEINGSKAKLLFFRLEKMLFAKRTLFHATSDCEKELILRFFGRNAKVTVLPNYMHLPDIMPRKPKEQYLLYVGRITPGKALDRLIGAAALSEKFRRSEYKLLITDYVEKQFLQTKEELVRLIAKENLQDKVLFIDRVTGTAKDQLYADAYMSFCVSHSENFGNVVIESLAQGTPVVASTGTPWEILNLHKAGFWKENDVRTLANCINTLLGLSEKEYQSMRINALNLSKMFDVKENIYKWMEILNQLKTDE